MKSLSNYSFYIETDIEKAHVASVAVISGTKILMGKRNDNGRWTLPGGHFDDGEDMHEAVAREMKEEAGIDCSQGTLEHLGSDAVTTFTGKRNTIHAFKLYVNDKVTPSSKNDPDKEVKKWEWIETVDGLPEEVAENLHSPKNVVLRHIGLQTEKSMFFITDLIKAAKGQTVAGHKYIRKFLRGGKWHYVYHEAGKAPRALTEAAIKLLKQAADAGHAESKALHGSIEAHDEGKLTLLRQAADMGHAPSHEHLKSLGIDRKAEKLEEQLIPRSLAPKDEMDEVPHDPAGQRHFEALRKNVTKEVEESIAHLRHHMDTPIAQALMPVFQQADLLRGVNEAKSVRQLLDATHELAKKLEQAQGALSARRPGTHVTYGNFIYNKALGKHSETYLPKDYATEHKRTARSETHHHKDLKPFRERQAAAEKAEQERKMAEEKARAEEERRQMAAAAASYETHRDSVDKMSNYFGKMLGEVDKRKLAMNIEKFFGSSFKFQRFFDHLQGHKDVEIRIGAGFFDGLMRGGDIGVRFTFHAPDGRRITYANRTIERHPDGSIEWHNGVFNRASNQDLKRYNGMASGLYGGVENFLREISKDWTGARKSNTRVSIGSAANGGWGDSYKGSNVWAKHYFEWSGDHKSNFSMRWKPAARDMLTRIGREADLGVFNDHIDGAEHLYQFVKTGVKLTKSEAERATGRSLDFDFNQIIERNGHIDLGDLIMTHAQASYGGAVAYINKTTGRHGELNAKRRAMYDKILPENRSFALRPMRSAAEADAATATASRAAETRRSEVARTHGISTREQDNVDYYSRAWGRGGASVRITERRLRSIRSWTQGQRNYFLATARLTTAAKNRIRTLGVAT